MGEILGVVVVRKLFAEEPVRERVPECWPGEVGRVVLSVRPLHVVLWAEVGR